MSCFNGIQYRPITSISCLAVWQFKLMHRHSFCVCQLAQTEVHCLGAPLKVLGEPMCNLSAT